MPTPDNFSAAAYDARQGRDDVPDDRGEYDAVRDALAKMQEAADVLRGVESSDARLNCVCSAVGASVELLLGEVWKQIP